MAEYLLPDVGEGLTEAEIVAWKVKVGDVIAVNDIVVEIETAKSLVELPSPYAGTVTAILVEEGDDRRGRDADHRRRRPRRRVRLRRAAPSRRRTWRSTSPTRPRPEVARARAWSAATRPTAGRPGGRARSRPAPWRPTSRRRRPSRPVSPRRWSRPPSPRSPCRPPRSTARDREPARRAVLAKPPVRKLAKDLGIDLATVTGTGPERVGHPGRPRRSPAPRPPAQARCGDRATARPGSRSRASAR